VSVEGVLARGRTAALQLLRDTCTVERKTGDRVFDPGTGQYAETWEPVHSGPCRVKRGEAGGRDAELGDVVNVTLHRYEVRLPWDATPEIRRDDRLTITASDDVWLVGRPLEVVDVAYAGTSTVRKLIVEDRS
jgi:hypothetical protein